MGREHVGYLLIWVLAIQVCSFCKNTSSRPIMIKALFCVYVSLSGLRLSGSRLWDGDLYARRFLGWALSGAYLWGPRHDWAEGVGDREAAEQRHLPIPQGALESDWPFRVIPNWRGGVRHLYAQTDHRFSSENGLFEALCTFYSANWPFL